MYEQPTSMGTVVADRLARLVEGASEVADEARSCSRWKASARAAALASLDAVVAAVAQARAHLLVADREAGDSQRPGDRSFEAARARLTRGGIGEAGREVRQADALVSMPTVAAGVRDRSVPLPHLDVPARAAAGASPEVAAVLRSASVQAELVAMARAASAPDFAKALARFVATQDPAGLEQAHQDAYRERFFALSVQPHGVFLKGRLDVAAAESLRVALHAMGQHPDETRSPGQASADALAMTAERVCAGTTATAPVSVGGRLVDEADPSRPSALGRDELGGPLPEGALPDGAGGTLSGTAARPHLSLLVPAETFGQLLAHETVRPAALRGADGRRALPGHSAGGPSGRIGGPRIAPDVPPVVPATLEDGTPVAMSELARCLCDADITRIVMSAEGLPLDVGRTRRLHTPAQRKAMIARDQQCVWNGCETPAARCEVHRILWWNRDRGPTDVEHAALACRHHHGEIHRGELSIERLPRVGRDGPTRYIFRTPEGDIANAPPRWSGDTAARSDRGPGDVMATGSRGPGAMALGSRGPSGSSNGASTARPRAREHGAFASFDSPGPPPDWAAG